MQKLIHAFYNNESGATAIEYALILAGIAAVIIASVQALGIKVTSIFDDITNRIQKN